MSHKPNNVVIILWPNKTSNLVRVTRCWS